MEIVYGVGGIYKITNSINGKIYIGSTKCFRTRFSAHRSLLGRNVHGNRHLQNSWNKYGESAFDFSIVEVVIDENELIEREQHWIDQTECYKDSNGYNICKVASSRMGVICTEEHKRKISIANKGRVFSAKARENMGRWRFGYKQSEEHIANRMKTVVESGVRKGENHHFYGKNFTEHHKNKIKDAHIGKHVGSDNNLAKLTEDEVRHIKTLLKEGKLSQIKIAEMFNVSKQNISCINRGKSWTHVVLE